MIRIRTEQARELEKLSEESFVDRVTDFVRAEFPGTPESPARGEIAALVERARGYDLTLESTIVTYVIAAQLLGPDFADRLPAARALLEAPNRGEELKAMDLEALVLASLDD